MESRRTRRTPGDTAPTSGLLPLAMTPARASSMPTGRNQGNRFQPVLPEMIMERERGGHTNSSGSSPPRIDRDPPLSFPPPGNPECSF